MDFKVQKARGSGPQRCRYISEQYLELYIGSIEANPVAGVDTGVLRDLAAAFQQKQNLLEPVCQRSFDDCDRSRNEHEFDDKRINHLGRLIGRLVEDHFVENGGKPPEEGGLSRGVLPGLLIVLELAVGSDLQRSFQERSRTIVERLREEYGSEFEWDDYYSDRDAQEMLASVLIALARSFADYGKRKEWAIDVIKLTLPREKKLGRRRRSSEIRRNEFFDLDRGFVRSAGRGLRHSGQEKDLRDGFRN